MGYSENYFKQMVILLDQLKSFAKKADFKYWSAELYTAFLNSPTVRNQIPPVTTIKKRQFFLNKLVVFAQNGSLDSLRSLKETEEDSLSEDFKENLRAYDEYRTQSTLTENSLGRDRRMVVHVLFYFFHQLKRKSLNEIQPGDTVKAIEWLLEVKYQPSSLATALSGLRLFYRIHPVLNPYAAEIPSKIQRERKIIETFTQKEETELLACLKSDKLSKRNKAIGLLMFETGLRGTDITAFQLSDIDWEHSCINLLQSKTKKTLTLPLSPVVGNALIEYLLNERPSTELATVFLTLHPPYRPLKSVYQIMSSIAQKAGLTPKAGVGPRAYRHSVATRMLNNGTVLPLIAQKLGHSSPDTTMVYLNTDKRKMAALTLPLPEAML